MTDRGYYTSEDNWQEYDCPQCLMDFDVSPIPMPDTIIYCSGCGSEWKAGEHAPNTYVTTPEGEMTCVDYPESKEVTQ